MLALFYSYSLLQLVQEALASRRITIAIARPGGILSLSNGYEKSDESSGSFAPYLSSWEGRPLASTLSLIHI